MIKYNIDFIFEGKVVGWAADDSTVEPLTLLVIFQGKSIYTVIANKFRKDLLVAKVGNGCYGFEIDLDDLELPTGECALSIIENTTGRIIGDTINYHAKSNSSLLSLLPEKLQGRSLNVDHWPSLNWEGKNFINVYTVTFFDFDGKEVFPGGAERYIFDLAKLASSLGFILRVFQAGSSYWERNVEGLVAYALPHPGTMLSLSDRFANMTPKGMLNIYSPFTLATANLHQPSIGICHGVYWDVEGYEITQGNNAVETLSSIIHLNQVVSVDANSINFFRGFNRKSSEKIKYIPNYVDETFFNAKASEQNNRDIITIIYPRRLYGARGYWLISDILDEILEEFDNIKFLFIGGADSKETNDVLRKVSKYKGRVEWHVAFPNEMPEWYAKSDIALIPTVNSEGTSLSALEALAAGIAVIATDVGGLSNIIINELNGLLVSPTKDDLKSAIFRLIKDRSLRAYLSRMGVETAKAFNKSKWNETWRTYLEPFLANSEVQNTQEFSPTKIVHLRTDGISWGVGDSLSPSLPRQRPHHIMKALALSGFRTVCISDETIVQPVLSQNGRNVYLGRGAKLYETSALIYVYYAYHIWILKDRIPKSKWAKFSKDFVEKINATNENHDIKNKRVWFDLIDSPEIHEDKNYSLAVALMLEYSDIVSTSSRVLWASIKESTRRDIILVENGSWFSDFNSMQTCSVSHNRINNLRLVKSTGVKIVGYMGALASWFDFSLVESLLKKTDYIILIAGPVSNDSTNEFNKLLSIYPNLIYLNTVPYQELPELLSLFDVGIIPFKVNKITDVTNPVKLWEMLSAGVPVVSTAMQETKEISLEQPQFIRIATTPESFLLEINDLLELISNNGAGIMDVALSFACHNSWLERVYHISKLLLKHNAMNLNGSRNLILEKYPCVVQQASASEATSSIYANRIIIDYRENAMFVTSKFNPCPSRFVLIFNVYVVPGTYAYEIIWKNKNESFNHEISNATISLQVAGKFVLESESKNLSQNGIAAGFRIAKEGIIKIEMHYDSGVSAPQFTPSYFDILSISKLILIPLSQAQYCSEKDYYLQLN